MKLLKYLCFVLLVLCVVFEKSHETDLTCEFEDKSIEKYYFHGYWSGYTCNVYTLDNTNNTMVIAGYSGIHLPYRDHSDVEWIYIESADTKYFPKNLGLLFNLTKLTMLGFLVEIESQDFVGMQNLEYLNLSNNKLTSVPIDVFSTLPKLKEISLYDNQIEEISNGVFANNLQLEKIHLNVNKIHFIGSSLFDELTELKKVNLIWNVCINGEYTQKTITQLRNKIKNKCKNPNVFGEKLKCQFQDSTSYYTCEVSKLNNRYNDMAITGYSGAHISHKTESDVNTIYIENTNTKYIPKNLGLVFNLTVLKMWRTHLVEIKYQDFDGMKGVVELHLSSNSLTSVPVKAFSKLKNLEKIDLSSNEIQEISNGVFANNLNLKNIWLQENKIQFLGTSLFSGLTKLGLVNLKANFCIKKSYAGSRRIVQLKNDIKGKCENPIATAQDLIELQKVIGRLETNVIEEHKKTQDMEKENKEIEVQIPQERQKLQIIQEENKDTKNNLVKEKEDFCSCEE